jgi:uncharacterized protein (TIGR02996 family)
VVSDEAALLRTICENPDDDAPRLVYCDWLEESGDPAKTRRAHFIRMQCELAKYPEPRWEAVPDKDGEMWRVRWSVPDEKGRYQWVRHYPAKDHPGKHFAECDAERMNHEGREVAADFMPVDAPLRSRERSLLKKHWKEWVPDYSEEKHWAVALESPLGPTISERIGCLCFFRRGFVEQVRCPWNDWRDRGNRMCTLTPLRNVELTGWPRITVQVDEAEEGYRFTLEERGRVLTISEDDPEAPTDPPEFQRWSTARLLEAEWPGIRFTLPCLSRRWTGRVSMDMRNPQNWDPPGVPDWVERLEEQANNL